MFDEYYLSKRPEVYTNKQVEDALNILKLKCGIKLNISDFEMVNFPDEYKKHLHEEIATEIGHKMIEEGKIKFSFYKSPVMGREMTAEALLISKEDLYKLLGTFGIYIEITQKKYE